MAVVGSAEVIVRAITLRVKDDIKKAFDDAKPVVSKAGRDHAKSYTSGFSGNIGNSMSDAISSSLNKVDTNRIGTGHGGDYSGGFMSSLASGIDIEGAIGRVDLSGVGSDMGDSLSEGLDRSTDRMGQEFEGKMNDAGGRGGRGFTRGFEGSGFDAAAAKAADSFSVVFAAGQFLGTGLAALVGGLSAAVSGLFAMASAAAQAGPALAVLPSLMTAAAQAGLTLKLAFGGVGEAMKAGLATVPRELGGTKAAVAGAAKAAISAAQAVDSAQRRVADASRTAARAVVDAKNRLAQAYQDSADASAESAQRVADAERDLAAAHNATRIAQLAVTDARKSAIETLQQLGFSAEDAALAEQRAGLNLQDALQRLQQVQGLPPDNRMRVEAELAFKEAELNYRQAKDRAGDLATEQAKAAKAGVDGTKEVVDAKNAVIDKQNDEEEAERKLAQTRADQAKTAADSANRIAQAQLALSRAQADGARNVAEAQRDLTRALQQQAIATDTGAAATDKFNESLKGLSPQAQSFVRYLVSIQDEMKGLRDAAGAELFPKLQAALQPIVSDLFPQLQTSLTQTGSALGDVAIKFSDVVTSSEGMEHIKNIMDTNNQVIGIGGDVMANLATVALRLLDAVRPLTVEFANWVKAVTDGWVESTKGADGMKKLSDTFTTAGDVVKQLWSIFKNLWGVVMDLVGAGKEAGGGLLDSFEGATAALKTFTGNAENQEGIKKGFGQAAETLKTIGGLIVSIGKGFLKIGASKEVGDAFKKVGEARPFIQQIVDALIKGAPFMANLFVQVTRIFAALASSDSTTTFFQTLTGVAKGLADVLSNDVVQGILKIVAPVLGILHAFRLLRIGVKLFATILKGTFQGIGPMLAKLKMPKLVAKPSAATGTFAANLDRLTLAFEKTSVAKDLFMGNLARLQTQFGAPTGAAAGAAGAAAGAGGKVAAAEGAAAAGAATKTGGALGKVGGAMSKVGGIARVAVGGLGRVVGVLMGPIGMIATIAIPLLITGFKKLYSGNAGFRKFIDNLVAKFKAIGDWIVKHVVPAFKAIGDWITGKLVPAISLLVGWIGAQLQPIFQALGDFFNNVLVPAFKQLADFVMNQVVPAIQSFGTQFMAALKPVIDWVKGTLWPVISRIFGFIVDFIVTKFVPVMKIVIPAAIKALVFVFTKILVPIIKNFVIPVIGFLVKVIFVAFKIILAIIVGVIKVIVWLFVNIFIPLFTKIIIPVIKGLIAVFRFVFNLIVAIVTNTINGIKWVWDNILKPVIDAIVAAFLWCVDQVKKFWTDFVAGLGVIWAGIVALWNTFGQPAIDAIAAAFQWVVDKIKQLWNNFLLGLQIIWSAIRGIWDKYGAPVIERIRAAFKVVVDKIKAILQGIRDRFQNVINAIKAFWTKFGQPIVDGIRDFFKRRIEAITGLFDTIRTKFMSAVNAVRDWFHNTGEGILDTIKQKWQNLVDGIGLIWDKIKDAPKVGLRNLINNLNNWLVKPLATIAGHFGLTIPTIPMPPGLAEGGPVEGQGGPRDDNQVRRLSVGEYVLRERATRGIGRGAADYINKHGRLPDQFPRGGILDVFKDMEPAKWLADQLKKGVGSAIDAIMGGFEPYLPKGDDFVSKLVRAIFGSIRSKAKDWGDKKQDKIDEERAKLYAPMGTPALPTMGKYGNELFSNEQLQNAVKIAAVASKYGRRATEIALMTAMVESNLYNLSGGDRDSVGLFQQRNAWGSFKARTTPSTATKMFLTGGHGGQRGLLDIPRWQSRPRGEVAQAVQVSAFPGRYATKYNEAKAIVDAMSKLKDAIGTGKSGWTYPLDRIFRGRNYAGHNPPWGDDIAAPMNTGVRAANSGKVTKVRNLGNRSYGLYIEIDHGNYSTLYAHLKSAGVKVGQRVGSGQRIGRSDNSGGSTGAHLHFEIKPSRDTITTMRNFGVKGFATGGIVPATPGGLLAMIGEAGRSERVEPLDRQGLSVRDRAMIDLLSRQGGTGNVDVRVFIGNRELTDIVDVRINQRNQALAQDLNVGTKRRYR